MKKNKDYQRLLSFAVGFKNRFALLLARSSFLDIREKWLKQLNCDLKEERIHVVHIHGDSWEKNSEKSITAFIRKHIPASRRYILSLSRFDYHMLPKFPENLKGKDLLSESYSPIPSPSSFIRRLNFERDAIIKAFPVPVIFWLSQAAVRQIAEYAPDFYDFRKFIIDLPQPTRLKHRPSIQATSFIKITKPEVLSPETYRTLEIKLAGLRSLERDTDKGRRFINILKDLAFSKYVPGKWEDGLNLLREGFAEALRLNMQDEQAHMKKQLAFFYYNMDRKTVALQLWEEAIEIYRKLVAKSAYLYLPTLVEALNFKAILLAELGRPLAAKIEFNETLRLARELFEKEPEVRSPIMAEVLNNYALFLTELKKLKEAEGIFKEAIALYRGLSNNKYRISLALVLNNFGNLMVSTNRLDAAFPLHQEALHLRRLLFTANPGLYRAQLCQSLYNLALLMGEVGNYEEADKLYEEALAAISHLPDSELEFNWRLTVGTKISRSVPHSQSKVDTNVENGSSNPYKWRNRLPAESKMFFGRQREMRRLWDLLEGESPQHISIVGERRIGKSSLAYRLFHELKKETAALAIYLDCHQLPKTGESGDTQETFYRRLSRSFKEALATNNTVSETLGKETGEFGNYREFRRFVGAVSGNNIKLVMFLDEFEHLPKKGFADNSFFSNLRALGDAPDFSLAFVTLSKRKLKELTHQSIQTSGFYNIFETVIIGLLDHESIKQMRESGFMDKGFSLDAEERKKISYYAGDFAFLNMLVCYFLWEKKQNNEAPDWNDLEDKLLQYYETLWDRSRDEQVLLKSLKKENDSGDFALKEMKVRGLLTKAGNLYYPFCEFFRLLIAEQFEVRKKDISEKDILKTTKEVLDVLTAAKRMLPG